LVQNHETLKKNFQKERERFNDLQRVTTVVKSTNPQAKSFRKRFEPKPEPKPFEIREQGLKIYIVSVNACGFQ